MKRKKLSDRQKNYLTKLKKLKVESKQMSESHTQNNGQPIAPTVLKNVLDRIMTERKNQRCFSPMVSPFPTNDDDLVK